MTKKSKSCRCKCKIAKKDYPEMPPELRDYLKQKHDEEQKYLHEKYKYDTWI